MKKNLVKILYGITALTSVIGAVLKITHNKVGELIFIIGPVSFVLVMIFDEIGKSKDK